jgi:hypothetical protein
VNTLPSAITQPRQRPRLKSFGQKKFARLNELIGRFDVESERCAKVQAYYAACVLQAAAFEGLLLAMCDGLLDEVEMYVQKLPSHERPKERMEKWSLAQLIKIAYGLKWLPSRRHIKGKRKTGDHVQLVKELRNIIHPGKHIRDYPNVHLREGHYSDSYTIVRQATGHLWQTFRAEFERPAGSTKTRKGR